MKLLRFKLILGLIFVTCLPAFAQKGRPGISGGGDPYVTEFLLLAHRLRTWQAKNPEMKAFDLAFFNFRLQAIEMSLNPNHFGPHLLQSTPDPITVDGIPKPAKYDAETGAIIFYRGDWNVMPEPLKYTMVATEFMGLTGSNRYVDSMIILQAVGEISQIQIELNPSLAIVDLKGQPGSYSTTSVSNTISFVKNMITEGVYKGWDNKYDRPCRVEVKLYPRHWIADSGFQIRIIPHNGLDSIMTILDQKDFHKFEKDGEYKAEIAVNKVSAYIAQNSTSVGGDAPWVHNDWSRSIFELIRNVSSGELRVRIFRNSVLLGKKMPEVDSSCELREKIGGASALK